MTQRASASSRWWLVAAGLLVLAYLLSEHWHPGAPAPPTARGPASSQRDNLLLITLDTTRADHLGCYGYARARTPRLDRLAAEGTRFQWAFTAAPITLPSHASILTSLYPFTHGVRNNAFHLEGRFPTLATLLQTGGYRTAAFVSSFILDRRYGLARGFETYDDALPGAQRLTAGNREAERSGDKTAESLLRWLEGQDAAVPFFVWLHLYDPHEPYAPPAPFREEFADAPYDGEIAFDDRIVGNVLDALGRKGMADRTLVAVIGDHGESLGEHGEETHTMFLYEGAVRVPMILWRPGRVAGGSVVDEPVRSVDLAPTLLGLLDAPAFPQSDGRDLAPVLQGKRSPAVPPVYAETLFPQLYMGWAPLRAVRDARYKFIDAPRAELYDLRRDPGEQQNLLDREPAIARAMKQALGRITGGTQGAMNAGSLDREAAEKLAALGYVGAGVGSAALPAGATAPDPKDKIALYNRVRRASRAVREHHIDEALELLHQILEEDPQSAVALVALGNAQMGQGDFAGALASYGRAAKVVPGNTDNHRWMAICHIRLGNLQAALREADAALALDPRSLDARILKGSIYSQLRDYDSAVRELTEAVRLDPTNSLTRIDLARVVAAAGRPAEAEAQYQAILDRDPRYAPAMIDLGALHAQRRDLDGAAQLLEQALAIEPGQWAGRFNLAKVREQQGRPGDAVAQYRQIAAAPAAPPEMRRAAQQRLATLGAR